MGVRASGGAVSGRLIAELDCLTYFEFRTFAAPEGLTTIAQQFTAGITFALYPLVPEGRLKRCRTRLIRPSLRDLGVPFCSRPSDKSLGYFRRCLRGSEIAAIPATLRGQESAKPADDRHCAVQRGP